jgi:hypothetical protein
MCVCHCDRLGATIKNPQLTKYATRLILKLSTSERRGIRWYEDDDDDSDKRLTNRLDSQLKTRFSLKKTTCEERSKAKQAKQLGIICLKYKVKWADGKKYIRL